jgi:hypothetical protein
MSDRKFSFFFAIFLLLMSCPIINVPKVNAINEPVITQKSNPVGVPTFCNATVDSSDPYVAGYMIDALLNETPDHSGCVR